MFSLATCKELLSPAARPCKCLTEEEEKEEEEDEDEEGGCGGSFHIWP